MIRTITVCDPAAVTDALRRLVPHGDVFEIRALDATLQGDRWAGTVSGYFDDPTAAAEALGRITSATGVYVTLNTITPALLARSANRLRLVKKDPTTADADVTARRWLPIDLDPVRPSGISANAEEHDSALDRAAAIRAYLSDLHWPDPIMGDSGNGGHLLYRIDLPADAESDVLVENCLKALSARFTDDGITVNKGVGTRARIWKLPGSLACKGDSTPDRPHRMAKIIHAPNDIQPVPLALLQQLATEVPSVAPKTQAPAGANGKHTFDVGRWIHEHNVPVDAAENWQGGRKWIFPACPFNSAHTNRSAVIIEGPDGKLGFKCHHNGCTGKDWHALRALYDPKEKRQPGKQTDTHPATPVMIRASDVVTRPVEWLWRFRIPVCATTVFAGDPGLGKSLLGVTLAATVSVGGAWPDGPHEKIAAGNVIIISAEDNPSDVIVPRLIAAGADLSKIHILTAVQAGDGERLFALSDIPALAAAMENIKPRLVIIDPCSAFMAGVDGHKNSDVRSILAPLAKLAEKYKTAVVLIEHLNKSGGGKALYRVQGSLAFIAAPRAAHAVIADKADPARRFVLPIKSNLSAQVDGLVYRVRPVTIGGLNDQPVIEWSAELCTKGVDELLAAESEESSAAGEARAFLKTFLADGSRWVKECIVAAAEDGISRRTLFRARKELKVITQVGSEGKYWALPGTTAAGTHSSFDPDNDG